MRKACLALAMCALIVRVWLAQRPLEFYVDETIIGDIATQNIATGDWSANWARFEHLAFPHWTHPTYQFSPYTWLQTSLGYAAVRAGMDNDRAHHIGLGRVTAAVYQAGAGYLVSEIALALAPPTALLAQALFIASPLSLIDGMRSRCDSFLALLSAWCFWLVITRRRTWAALCAGVLFAAKFNSSVVVAYGIALVWYERDGWPRRLALTLLAGVAGFVIATPELLRDPSPLWLGVQYEWKHYAGGQIPYQAHDWRDANALYWPYFFGALALGWPALVALANFLRRPRGWPWLWLACMLGALTTAATKIRFERNWEPVLPLLCVAVVLGASSITRRRWALGAVLLALPSLASARFIDNVLGPSTLEQARAFVEKDVTPMRVAVRAPTAEDTTRALILVGYADGHSRDGWERWETTLRGRDTLELRSRWSAHGYPFSAFDVWPNPYRTIAVKAEKP